LINVDTRALACWRRNPDNARLYRPAGIHVTPRKASALLAALAALSAPSNAPAQETERADEVRVIGHYENAVGTSDAASQGTITPKLIEERPMLRPGEVLEYVPGVIITQHSGEGKANQYFLRGFNLDHGIQSAERLVRRRAHSISGREPPQSGQHDSFRTLRCSSMVSRVIT